jgi:Transglutaminase-like superfamily
MIAALARFRRRSPAQRRLLVQAGLALAVMRLAIRLPFRTLSRVMGLHRGETGEVVEPSALARASAVGWAVRAAASHTPWESTCLMQALAAAALLRRWRIDGTLYLGVATETRAAEGMTAHAWLRCGDLVLTGESERARYTPVASFACTRRVGRAGAVRNESPARASV